MDALHPLRASSSLLPLDPWLCPGESLLVDDLLDFSNGDIGGPIGEQAPFEHPCDPSSSSFPLPRSEPLSFGNSAGNCSGRTALDSSQTSGDPLYVPPDELAELEWLSTFVEDSYTTDKPLAPLLNLNLNDDKFPGGREERGSVFHSSGRVCMLEEESNAFSERSSSSLEPATVVKGRPRSKRSRTGGRVWSLHMLATISRDTQSASEEFSEGSQSSSLEYEADDSFRPKKKASKGSHAKKVADNAQPRRCTHCQVQKTPQWRAGPLGPKTLCNACGVRYKSGRLVPEYRPAGSPSFVGEIHSNSHKKILEMRLQNHQTAEQEPAVALAGLAPLNFHASSLEFEDASASDESQITHE